mmetsp:Transcript_5293/g.15184  ORF Transcript_5293/g.15184 Transcript_5293/m.15184 type:complete len:701 (-) Transcript_5293:233-2335(-)
MAPADPAAGEGAEAKLKQLFTKLNALLKSGDGSLKRTLRLIDPILALAPGDPDVLKCKVVAYIRHEEFELALQLIRDTPASAGDLAFEQAYCYYRLGQLERALQAVQGVDGARRQARLQLEAQLHYKLGDYAAAIRIYGELFKEHKVESLELRTNVIAAYVCGGKAEQVPDVAKNMRIAAGDGSDVGFNMACALLQLGSFADAEQQLQLALRSGREELLEEDLEDDIIAEELAPLTAQLAFAQAHLGQADQAAAGLQELLSMEGLDSATAAVVANNRAAAAWAAAVGGAAPKKAAGDALRKLDPLVAPGSAGYLIPALEQRLLDSQKQEVLANRVLLMVAIQKQGAAEVALAALQKRFPSYHRLPLLQAALLAASGKVPAADAALQRMEGSGSAELREGAALMRAQLAASSGDAAGALAVLQQLPEDTLRHQPAVVATVVRLQEDAGNMEGAVQTLEAALEWWRHSMIDAPGSGAHPEHWLLQRLVQAKVAVDDVAGARQLYDEMAAAGGADSAAAQAEALASLATALGLRGETDVKGLQEGLPPLEPLEAATLARLENAPAASAPRKAAAKPLAAPAAAAIAAADSTQAAEVADEPKAKQKKGRKKRKPRYPAGFDPANSGPPPNPERWLPKWQRSEFKKQRKAMEKRIKAGKEVKGSQGKGVVDESLDVSNKARPDPAAARPAGAAAAKSAGRRKGRR